MYKSHSKANGLSGLIHWSLLRHKTYIPVFVIVQIVLAVAIMYGFLFIANPQNHETKSYLGTGATVLIIIAVTCVLAPQIISEAKQNGVLEYQKTLPISRTAILFSDLIVWSLIPLAGIIFTIFIAVISFDLNPVFNTLSVLSLLFIIVNLTLLGFSIAYIFPPNLVSLMTQVIMLGGLLFSPILYPTSQIPQWTAYIYNILPFVPASNIVRSSLFNLQPIHAYNYVVVLLWGLISFFICILTLKKRD